MTLENTGTYKEGINDKQIKMFSSLFSTLPKKKKTAAGERVVYDIATQYFIYGDTNLPIYGSFDFKKLINKIVKDNWGDFLDIESIDDNVIDEFRKYFYKHPEFISFLFSCIDEGDELRVFNEFLKYAIEYKILRDEDLGGVREIRQFIYYGQAKNTNTGNLFDDLYNLFNFHRFKKDGYLQPEEYEHVLHNMVADINAGRMENPLEFKSYVDWNQFPDEYIELFEKIILKNYTYDPLSKTTKKQTCDAIDEINFNHFKKLIGFNPRGFQRYFLVMESRENLAANSRRSGKSVLAVYVSIRQILLPQQLVLYILPNKEGFSEQPFFYIEKFFDTLKQSQGIEGNLPGLQFNNKTFKVTNKESKSKILFISSQGGTKGGRSFSANLIVMDEAGYNPDEDIYDVSYSATTDTRGRMFAISTINKDTPINWFFYKKIDLDGGDDSVVMVVDIYQNEFIPDDEKRKIEEKYKGKNQKIWLSEYMAIFVGQGDMFDISGFFRLDFEYEVLRFNDFSFNFYKKLDRYERFVIGRDPGRSLDPGGIAVLGIRNRNEAELICTGYIRVPNYIIQLDAVMEMYNYLKKQRDTSLIIDIGKAGIGMFDLLVSRQVYPYGVLSTGSGLITNPSPRLYNIGNPVLEGNLKNIMNTSTLKGFSWLDNIRHEYETFEASKTRQGTNHHHDILSALMIATTVSLEKNWLSFRKEINHEEKSNVEILEEIIYGVQKRDFHDSQSNRFLY